MPPSSTSGKAIEYSYFSPGRLRLELVIMRTHRQKDLKKEMEDGRLGSSLQASTTQNSNAHGPGSMGEPGSESSSQLQLSEFAQIKKSYKDKNRASTLCMWIQKTGRWMEWESKGLIMVVVLDRASKRGERRGSRDGKEGRQEKESKIQKTRRGSGVVVCDSVEDEGQSDTDSGKGRTVQQKKKYKETRKRTLIKRGQDIKKIKKRKEKGRDYKRDQDR
ncbi:LOW QUALITY PROTEIN: hypothetical protein CVT26_016181 [Gymnopilus dilepis]|uniref:Uncharacterized protein n=1 Tax=Gymnopilus dilepis TaxID=231916 RepID=A0A409XZ69_9AGAR|nr:LOW QUALITY PROTEIN: hypothetical protein CVT26_016181 [Gymnopilus dilepis]